jgi:ABC-type transport system involved in cytochrome bd biosynthesis fused ATPase/permease subunit
MIVVELAGQPGVGKSSIALLLAKKLRDEFGEGVIAALPERDRPRQQRHWTRFKRWSWLLSHPRIYCAAHRLNSLGDRLTLYSNLVRNFSVMGVAHQLAQTGCKVVLGDQGGCAPQWKPNMFVKFRMSFCLTLSYGWLLIRLRLNSAASTAQR